MLYKGCIIDIDYLHVESKTLECSISSKYVEEYVDDESIDLNEIKGKNNEKLYSYLMDKNKKLNVNKEEEIEDEIIIKILDLEYFKTRNKFFVRDAVDIIFEIVVDKDGNRYAKELYSGRLFPFESAETKRNRYFISIYDRSRFYVYNNLYIKADFHHPMFSKISCVVVRPEIANQNEIDEYKTMFDRGLFHDKKRENFINARNYDANKNVLKEEIETFKIEELPKKEREKQDNTITTMENIEYLLLRLKKINKESYDKYKELYKKVLQEEDILNRSNIQISSLISLEAKLEFELLFTKGENTTLSDKLMNLEQDYLNRLKSKDSDKTTITLDDLDKLMELFLKTKKDYSILEQRKILRSFSTIYTLEVKENEDEIDTVRLQNSYFNDIKKSILLCIDTLIEEGYIKDNLILDLSKEESVEEILEIIRSLEINKENDKKLVL